MTRHSNRVLDPSALNALFWGRPTLARLLTQAEDGTTTLLLPACAVVDAEHQLGAGAAGWEPLLLTPGVLALPLAVPTAVEVGGWPASLAVRQVVHEARALRAAVVTCEPDLYAGFDVTLLAV